MGAETRRYIDWIKRNLDRSRGLTQSGLARHLGVAHPQVTMLLQGKRGLKVDDIPRIASYLGVDPPGSRAVEINADELAEFIRLLPHASEEARRAALVTLRLGQPSVQSLTPQPSAKDQSPAKE